MAVPTADQRTTVEEIGKLEERWIRVYVANDSAAFAELLTDDFVYSSERGVFDKEGYVANLASGEIEMRGMDVSDHELRIYGNDVVISTGTVNLRASYQGQDISGLDLFTRVWVKGPDGWKAAAQHASEMVSHSNLR